MNPFSDTLKRITVNPILRSIGRRIEKRHFSEEPVFIVAAPRSGTTLLLALLGSQPGIFAMPHQTYGFAKWKQVNNRPYAEYPIRIDRFYRYLISHKIPSEATRWCEKTPRHVESIEKIADYFGNRVKIIHLIRDGRDVVVSKHPVHRPDDYWVAPARWTRNVAYGWSLRDKPYMYTLFYEKLVQDHRKYLNEICDFIGEPYTESMDNWIETTNVRKSKHWGHSVRPVSTKAIGKWQKPEHKERITEFMNHPETVALMKELGYIKN